MTTPDQQPREQQQLSASRAVNDTTYDPDEVIPRNSPLMKPLRLRLKPSPSPPPDIPPAQVSFSPFPTDGRSKSNRPKIRPISGDAILVTYLGNGSHPEIAQTAAAEGFPGVDENESDEDEDDDDKSISDFTPNDTTANADDSGVEDNANVPAAMATPNLQHLAAGALQVVAAEPRPPAASASATVARLHPDISTSTQHLSIHDDRYVPPIPIVSYPTKDHSRIGGDVKLDAKSPIGMLTPAGGELPPLQIDSPRSDTNSQSLPSIRSTLGDINRLTTDPSAPPDKDRSPRSHGAVFPRSPPAIMPRLHPLSSHHVSPPISPNETYPRNLPSPHTLAASSPYYYPNNFHRPSADYSSSVTGETPSTDQSGSTPATSTSVADRMSIDGITNPQVGVYICTFSGCNAPPFQTQYLLNSHANVHSSARPHYCPVKGCPRSEGGKGFKRKNEMIRHGLVHDSPGYVCPFCPDREHKYPRPDNLQRHVRVHHVDKSKDDPLLRDVLSQRPDGPNRGRRRRGPISG